MKPSKLPVARSLYRLTNRALAQITDLNDAAWAWIAPRTCRQPGRVGGPHDQPARRP
jgi:hypothetical protein